MKRLNDLLSGKENIKVAEVNATTITAPYFNIDRLINRTIYLGDQFNNIAITVESTLNIYSEGVGVWLFNNDGSFESEVEIKSPIIRSQGQLTLGSYTTALRPASQDEGSIIYDSTLKKCILYNGTAWVNLDGTALA